MTPAIIAGLLQQFGLPVVQYFVALYKSGNNPLTADQLNALVVDITMLSKYRSSDSLAANGIAIVDGRVVNITPPTPSVTPPPVA